MMGEVVVVVVEEESWAVVVEGEEMVVVVVEESWVVVVKGEEMVVVVVVVTGEEKELVVSNVVCPDNDDIFPLSSSREVSPGEIFVNKVIGVVVYVVSAVSFCLETDVSDIFCFFSDCTLFTSSISNSSIFSSSNFIVSTFSFPLPSSSSSVGEPERGGGGGGGRDNKTTVDGGGGSGSLWFI
jgi:hypothetical protein